MRNTKYPSLIDSITPKQLTTFLKRKSWNIVEQPNSNVSIFEGFSPYLQDMVTIALPKRQDFADYQLRLQDSIRILSQHYQQAPDTLVQQIVHWDRDVFKIRIESPLRYEQLLPLDFAAKFINQYRRFIAYAASTEEDPKRFFAKLPASGQEFAQKCLFGHTFEGSFGLTIECPLGLLPELPMADAPPPHPFPRAVTVRIATGYSNLISAVEEMDPDIIVNNHRTGFSGNMCDILADIYEIMNGREVTQKIIWAPELAPPQNLKVAQTPVRINQRSYEMLRAASDSLHTVDEPDEDKTIVGRVTLLRSEKPPLYTKDFAKADRTIVVHWEVDRKQPLRVHIELSLDHYLQACDAHKNGMNIRIQGKPKKIGNIWNLIEHHDFEIIKN